MIGEKTGGATFIKCLKGKIIIVLNYNVNSGYKT